MNATRTYVLPGTQEEKRNLIDDIARRYRNFFRAPCRQPLIANWWRMSVGELRTVADNWKKLEWRLGTEKGSNTVTTETNPTTSLDEARAVAERLVESMRPYCTRVEIAGSIRRGASRVKDIEIVAIPRYEDVPVEEQLLSLFASPPRMAAANMLHFWAMKLAGVRWSKTGTSEVVDWTPKPDGKYWRALVDGRIKLDLFLDTRDNFGLILLIRTGCAEFSQAVVTYAKHRTSFRVDGGYLRAPDGSALETCEERDVFDALRIDWIEPRARTGQHMVAANGRPQFNRKERGS